MTRGTTIPQPASEHTAAEWPRVTTPFGDNVFELAIVKLAMHDASFAEYFEPILRGHIHTASEVVDRQPAMPVTAEEVQATIDQVWDDLVGSKTITQALLAQYVVVRK